jgi:hypothetical protein
MPIKEPTAWDKAKEGAKTMWKGKTGFAAKVFVFAAVCAGFAFAGPVGGGLAMMGAMGLVSGLGAMVGAVKHKLNPKPRDYTDLELAESVGEDEEDLAEKAMKNTEAIKNTCQKKTSTASATEALNQNSPQNNTNNSPKIDGGTDFLNRLRKIIADQPGVIAQFNNMQLKTHPNGVSVKQGNANVNVNPEGHITFGDEGTRKERLELMLKLYRSQIGVSPFAVPELMNATPEDMRLWAEITNTPAPVQLNNANPPAPQANDQGASMASSSLRSRI